MIFTIEEINQNATLLPNIKLGFFIYDSCDTVVKALESTVQLLTSWEKAIPNFQCQFQQPVTAIVGDAKSKVSIAMGRLLGLQRFPQISYGSSVKVLSDKIQFPSFLRTAPSDEFQSYGLAKLISHYGWTWVGILAEDTDYGEQGTHVLIEELKNANVCIDFLAVIPTFMSSPRVSHIVKTISESSAKIIVVFSSDVVFYPVMEEIIENNITGKTWIGSDAWSSSQLFNQQAFLGIMHGSLGFHFRSGEMPRFEEFISNLNPLKLPEDIFIHRFWEQTFKCQWESLEARTTWNNKSQEPANWCTGHEKLKDVTVLFVDLKNLRVTYNLYNAIYTIAHALKEMSSCVPGKGPFNNRTCVDIKNFQPWQVFHYLKSVHFINNMGEQVFFDIEGNPPAMYDVINWQMSPGRDSIKHVNVGRFDSTVGLGKDLILNERSIEWNGGQRKPPRSVCSESCPLGSRKTSKKGKPACCYDCVSCSEGEIANRTDSTECTQCPEDYWPNKHQNQCLEREIEFLSYQEPLGHILTTTTFLFALVPITILVVFIKFRHTPMVKANNRELSYLLLIALMLCMLCSLIFIGQPGTLTCVLRQVTFGIVFVFGISCVLAKTIMVVLAFRATKPNNHFNKWIGPHLSRSIVSVCTLIQVIVCSSWLTTSPPFLEKNTKYKRAVILLECNQGSATAFWCMIGYMGLLAVVSFIVAFLSRKLPDNFNEAKFITFSMLLFASVWLSFIPAYLSTHGKYMVAVEIFAILASSAGLVFCIFIPKLYIILIHPAKNTRDYLMGKKDFSNKKMKF